MQRHLRRIGTAIADAWSYAIHAAEVVREKVPRRVAWLGTAAAGTFVALVFALAVVNNATNGSQTTQLPRTTSPALPVPQAPP
ncbi:MAG: hypothetical protein H0W01_11310, partial [Pseudonocardiales bacterium]|nr:hypothetical protein [Pseudonocardiales bacterium]